MESGPGGSSKTGASEPPGQPPASADAQPGIESSLHDSEQSLAMVLDSIASAFIAIDAAGLVTRMNVRAEQITGWRISEARQRSIYEVLVREGRPPDYALRNPIELTIDLGITLDTLQRIVVISRYGERTPVELRMGLVRDETGSVSGVNMVFRDVKQLSAAEDEARRLASIVESSVDAIIGKTLEGRVTSWNRSAETLFGYSALEAIGMPVARLIPADRLDEEMSILANLRNGRVVPSFDTVRLAKNGRPIHVSVTISPIRDPLGRIVGGAKIARDITTERQTALALRDSESRLRFALDAASLGEWTVDLASGEVQRSMWHDRCFGYAEMQPRWTLDIGFSHVHPNDRALLRDTFDVAVAERRDWHVEGRVIWPDGTVHWISLHAGIYEEAGAAPRMQGVISDITSQRLAEDARLRAQRLEAENRQIQEASRLKNQFLANMSHELRTPLNAIIGFGELLESGGVPIESAKHREFAGHIATSGRHLLQLINDVLDLAKVESGKFDFRPEPLELGGLVDELLGVLRPDLAGKHIDVAIELDASVGMLRLDPVRLKQVLYNYLSNAIKFTPVHGRILIRALPEGATHLRLEVEDSGIGIAPDDLTRLFVEFQQLDAGYSKQHQGTGLGLALTRRLVELQGGSVGVRSELGRGSIFHAILPRVHEPASDAALSRLLMIEADHVVQATATAALDAAGFLVDRASTVDEAREQANLREYQAIMLALVVDGRSGLDALSVIRSAGPNLSSPVRTLSVAALPGNAATFAIADILCKPLRADEIVHAMTTTRLMGDAVATVLVVDDDVVALDLMRATLMSLGIDAVCITDGRKTAHYIAKCRPQALILDLMMPEFDGFQVLDQLRATPSLPDLPVFIWTSMELSAEDRFVLRQSAGRILAAGGGGLDEAIEVMVRQRALAGMHEPEPS